MAEGSPEEHLVSPCPPRLCSAKTTLNPNGIYGSVAVSGAKEWGFSRSPAPACDSPRLAPHPLLTLSAPLAFPTQQAQTCLSLTWTAATQQMRGPSLPNCLRMAFHDAGTYSTVTDQGGCVWAGSCIGCRLAVLPSMSGLWLGPAAACSCLTLHPSLAPQCQRLRPTGAVQPRARWPHLLPFGHCSHPAAGP